MEMCDEGYIIDYGKLETSGGRHPNLYGLNPESGYFVGVDIKKFAINIGMINFKGDMMEKKHKSGFVNIVGNPNVGKSTLMNKLVGERISIITSKAQTTRHRIMGIVNTDDMQIVYSDTPGVLRPNY